MKMRFRTRAFLICFVPFALLLSGSFWMVQRVVQLTVQNVLSASLRENQRAIVNIHAKSNLQNSRFLKVAGENATLKAGMQLLLSKPGSETARRTVEDQLRELGEHMGFDYLVVSGPNGAPLAGVVREAGPSGNGELVPLNVSAVERSQKGLVAAGANTVQIASVPVDQGDENLGSISVGEDFSLTEFTTPAVLIHDGKVIQSNIPGTPFAAIDDALHGCTDSSECELRLQGARWISLPMQTFGGGYVIRSLANVDLATNPVQVRLHKLFLTVAIICVLIALLSSLVSSRSIVKPIAALVWHLRRAVRTGVLAEFREKPSTILEMRELADSYNRAAVSVRVAGETLEAAYLEFVGSLANALDARDPYTSGHSWRVSQMSHAVAEAMKLAAVDAERIRIGALLHDIGKIGIADSVLQKRGVLTTEEFAIVKEHPVIGRRILEGVQGLTPFLDAVEQHHENWDGSGYPKGQRGEETSLDARIVHVSDAYDAMTTDRSYRRGISHAAAIRILREKAGSQYDPAIVEVFTNLPMHAAVERPGLDDESPSAEEFAELEAR